MITRKTKLQLIAFVVISITAVVYALFRFTDIGKVFGDDPYTVAVEMPDSGGVFPAAEVTYRGYNVGRVGQMKLTDDGIITELIIQPGMPPIPANSEAVVMNRSAIGEQLVDLRPTKPGGPYLKNNSVIPLEKTKLPPRTDEVIGHMFKLAETVPIESLRTVVDESYDAFGGTYGNDLQLLMDTTRDFVRGAKQNLPDTVSLLEHGNKVLRTQNEEFGNFRSFTEDLKLVSESLQGSDADLRKLIDESPGAARQLSEVVHEIGPGLSHLIANLTTIGRISDTRTDGLEQALVTYPALSSGGLLLLNRENNEAPLGFTLNLFDPPPCVKGYEDTNRRKGSDETDSAHNTDAYCAEPPGSPIDVRGSQNAPRPGSSNSPSDQELQENADRDQESLEEQRKMDGTPDVVGSLPLGSFAQMLGLG